MSHRHREAIAHLLYGLKDASGFVQLTGEVGTGKTTLCRHVIAELPDTVDVALIVNPRMTEWELVQTICIELNVQHRRRPTIRELVDSLNSIRELVDSLNSHLMRSYAAGRRTIVIVDEAQNLSAAVLEQLRLLTNLETSKEKLLHVILVGQPELAGILARPALRPLAQRITARYHLLPLSPAETHEYVRHRLAIAGCSTPIFTGRALRRIHRRTNGVPRLINILCDRALLGAYARDRHVIGASMITTAAREIAGERQSRRGRLLQLFRATGLVTLLLTLVAIALWGDTSLAWLGLPLSFRAVSSRDEVEPPASVAAFATPSLFSTSHSSAHGAPRILSSLLLTPASSSKLVADSATAATRTPAALRGPESDVRDAEQAGIASINEQPRAQLPVRQRNRRKRRQHYE